MSVPAATPAALIQLPVIVEDMPAGVTISGATVTVTMAPSSRVSDPATLSSYLLGSAYVVATNKVAVDWQGGIDKANYVVELLVEFSDGFKEPYQIELPIRTYLGKA